MTYNWYYSNNADPRQLAQLSSRERSERAAWRSSLRQALAQRRTDRLIATIDDTTNTAKPTHDEQTVSTGTPAAPQPEPVSHVGGPERSPAMAGC